MWSLSVLYWDDMIMLWWLIQQFTADLQPGSKIIFKRTHYEGLSTFNIWGEAEVVVYAWKIISNVPITWPYIYLKKKKLKTGPSGFLWTKILPRKTPLLPFFANLDFNCGIYLRRKLCSHLITSIKPLYYVIPIKHY